MAYDGSCHCGAVTFSVDADPPAEAMACNCSHCRRKGFLLAFHPADALTIESGEDALVTYTFNTHKLQHRFCPTCGVEPFATGTGPDGSAMAAINLRAVPGVDPDALTIQKVDGASF